MEVSQSKIWKFLPGICSSDQPFRTVHHHKLQIYLFLIWRAVVLLTLKVYKISVRNDADVSVRFHLTVIVHVLHSI